MIYGCSLPMHLSIAFSFYYCHVHYGSANPSGAAQYTLDH